MSTFSTILVTTSLSRYSASIGGVVQSSGPRSMRVGQTYRLSRVVDGRHFRPTGFAPDEPCQEVEILDFLCHFLSVHWDLVQMKLYSLSAVWFPLWNLAVRFA